MLICDDSPVMRKLLGKMVSTDLTIEVVGEANNGEDCLAKVQETRPDVVLLDLMMPGMDGLACLHEARTRKLDTVFLVVSSHAKANAPITLEALRLGALDFVTKPQATPSATPIHLELLAKLRAAHEVKLERHGAGTPLDDDAESAHQPLPLEVTELAEAPGDSLPEPAEVIEVGDLEPRRGIDTSGTLTIIGGSSGCLQVLPACLDGLPDHLRGAIVLVLKLPAFLADQLPAQFAARCPVPILMATAGAVLEPERIYVAPGGPEDLLLEADPGGPPRFRLVETAATGEIAPCIDTFMTSAAAVLGARCRGVLVSGTGVDGIDGLRAILDSGGQTAAQDHDSALAPQLPQAADSAGVVQKVVTPVEMADLFR
ncbi:MAG: response regulator [Candidatus Riflebacteria bacterium]|nr:response regulator [Candidatus Riflebacteria bacterium]